ncbi:hypothetical protein M3231_20345 [Neobacillus mesonae]|nr:hypothetical protein [Neobacillus mesonae]
MALLRRERNDTVRSAAFVFGLKWVPSQNTFNPFKDNDDRTDHSLAEQQGAIPLILLAFLNSPFR